MKVNQLKMGVVFNYTSQAVSILTGLLYTPVMLRLLGQSEYGLYQLVYSVVSYLSLLSLGFGSGYVRFYSRYKAQGDPQRIARLNGMYLTVFSSISVICLICGSLMAFNAGALFGTGLTPSEIEKARILLGLMVINVSLTFINSVFESNITVHERFFYNRGLNFLHILLNPFITLPLLLLGFGSVAIVSVNVCFTLTILSVNIFYCLKNLKIRFSFSDFDFGLLKEIAVFTSFIFVAMIVDRINLSIGKFLLGRMIGTVAVAIFGVASQINILYVNFSTAISQMFIPRINMIVSREKSNAELTTLFARVGRIQFLVLALIVSGYVVFGREFIAIWAGPEYRGAYYVGLLLMIPGLIPLIQNLGVEIQKAKNMHKVCAIVNLCIAIANIIISILLIKKYSYIGAATGTALSVVVGNVFMNWYYHKKIGIDVFYFWKEISKLFPALAFAVIFALVLNRVIPPGPGIVSLTRNIIIYALVYGGALWCMGMNKSEKNLILVPLGAIKSKIQGKTK